MHVDAATAVMHGAGEDGSGRGPKREAKAGPQGTYKAGVALAARGKHMCV